MIGVVIESQLVEYIEEIKKLFTDDLPNSPELEYLRNQGFNIIFFAPSQRPIPSNQFNI